MMIQRVALVQMIQFCLQFPILAQCMIDEAPQIRGRNIHPFPGLHLFFHNGVHFIDFSFDFRIGCLCCLHINRFKSRIGILHLGLDIRNHPRNIIGEHIMGGGELPVTVLNFVNLSRKLVDLLVYQWW